MDEQEIIVLGYGGHDDSVMEILKAVPSNVRLYWCAYKDDELPEGLRNAANCFRVPTDGFTRVMDDLLHAVGFTLPDVEKSVREQRTTVLTMIGDSESPYKDEYLGAASEAASEEADRSARSGEADEAFALQAEGLRERNRDRYPEAIAAYRQALVLRPGDPTTLNDLGLSLLRNGQYPEAIAALRRSLELRPDHPTTLHNLGVGFSRDGQYQEAIATFRRSFELRPDNPDTLADLGLALALTSDDQWKTTFQRVLELTGDQPAAVRHQAARFIALMGTGASEEAVGYLRDVAPGWYRSLLDEALWDTGILEGLGREGAQAATEVLREEIANRQRDREGEASGR